MGNKTLHEVCDELGVTRRAIQGYEKAGLVLASGRNERGYLLYDEMCQERIRQIKLYQQLGFKIKEIKNLLESGESERKRMIEIQLQKLMGEKEQMDNV